MSASKVIQSCLDKGIQEFVVCAGARNLSFVTALSKVEDALVWNHFEERSAGFFALGRTMATSEPCAVITTSGTAVAELLPAVIEAHYQRRPLVIISADRPTEYRESGAPQAIQQVGVFTDYVAGCQDLVDGSTAFKGWTGRDPWHLNVCLGEEIEDVECDYALSSYQPERETLVLGDLVHFLQDVWSGLVVCIGGLEPQDREEVFHFVRDLKVPVVVDATSGLREALGKQVVAFPENILKQGMVGKFLRIGEVPVGRFWRDLEEKKDVDVFSITRTGYSGLARKSQVIKGDISRVLKGIGSVDEVGDVMGVMEGNSRHWAMLDELLEAHPDSEPGMVKVLSQYATVASSLYLGNSLPIREWNQFSQREFPVEFVRANRGANGIDGQLSTWLGNTAGVDDSWCVVGDLTALYDMSALSWLNQCGGARRVLVVINNSGGKIFQRLARVRELTNEVQSMVSNEHDWDFSHWAAMWGMDYARYDSLDDMDIEPGDNGVVVELVPSSVETDAFWEKFNSIV